MKARTGQSGGIPVVRLERCGRIEKSINLSLPASGARRGAAGRVGPLTPRRRSAGSAGSPLTAPCFSLHGYMGRRGLAGWLRFGSVRPGRATPGLLQLGVHAAAFQSCGVVNSRDLGLSGPGALVGAGRPRGATTFIWT